MNKHKFNIFPEMQEEDYHRLVEDIDSNGFDDSQPIFLYQGEILDGWNRNRACMELGIKPVFKDFVGTETEAIMFVMRTNKRRNLTSSQWACIAAEAEDVINIIRAESEKQRREKISESRKGETTQLIAPSKKEDNESRTKIAETFNTNRTYINQATKLKEEKPDVFEQVKSGKKTFTEVKKEEKIKERTELIEKQKKDIEEENIQQITGEFDVLVLDPPWDYGRAYDPDSSRVANPYPEMSKSDIMGIDIPSKDNSVMWLWTTHQFMRDAFEIMEHWGFDYKGVLTWNKEKMGVGYWLRMQCEFCLLGIKGKPIWDINDLRDIIQEPRREHSRKPESFYKMIDDKFTYASKLEYFSREKREGWEVYGNDVNKF